MIGVELRHGLTGSSSPMSRPVVTGRQAGSLGWYCSCRPKRSERLRPGPDRPILWDRRLEAAIPVSEKSSQHCKGVGMHAESHTGTHNRGFASMSPEKQREIARK